LPLDSHHRPQAEGKITVCHVLFLECVALGEIVPPFDVIMNCWESDWVLLFFKAELSVSKKGE
jgi:hypothetical protein